MAQAIRAMRDAIESVRRAGASITALPLDALTGPAGATGTEPVSLIVQQQRELYRAVAELAQQATVRVIFALAPPTESSR